MNRGTPSRRDKYVTLAAMSPPGVARGRFVGGQQSGLAGCKSPPLFRRGASCCTSQGQHQGERWGASPRPSAPSYLPTYLAPPESRSPRMRSLRCTGVWPSLARSAAVRSRAWTWAVAWPAPSGVCSRCVSAWSICARCTTVLTVRIVKGRRSRWPS